MEVEPSYDASGEAARVALAREEFGIMPAYLIADIDVRDSEAYAEYRRLAPATIEKYGGRYLVRAGATEVLEGDHRPARLVVLEFPNMATLKRWYDSEEYRALKTLRQRVTSSMIFAAEGVTGA